jgi:hypothetical protein
MPNESGNIEEKHPTGRYSDPFTRHRLRSAGTCRSDKLRRNGRAACAMPATGIAVLRGIEARLRATSELSVFERAVVVAGANQCRRAANKSIGPGVILASFEAPLRYCSLVGRWHRTQAGGRYFGSSKAGRHDSFRF